MNTLTVPARAITGTGNRTRAFLTEREAIALVTADGYTSGDIRSLLDPSSDDRPSFQLSTGAKINRVPAWLRSRACPTRARVWQVYGYHYAGTDVTDLVGAA